MVNFTTEQQDVILRLYDEGYGAPEIAKMTGFSKKTKMGRFIKQRGIGRSQQCRWDAASVKRQGERVGKLTLVSYTRQDGEPAWRCSCECGNEPVIKQKYLSSTRSCGCLKLSRGDAHRCWKGIGDLSGGLFSKYRMEARNRSFAFEVSKEEAWDKFLSQDRKCALTGFPLTMSAKSHGNASLDRIDSSKGYIKDNVQWVHKWVNLLKADLKEEDLFSIVRAIYEYRKVDKMPVVPLGTTLGRVNRKSSQ